MDKQASEQASGLARERANKFSKLSGVRSCKRYGVGDQVSVGFNIIYLLSHI